MVQDLIKASPDSVENLTPEEMMRSHISLFAPNDLIWIAKEVYNIQHPFFYKTQEWLENLPITHGTYISPSSYQKKEGTRKVINIEKNKYVVLEHDRMSKDNVAKIFMDSQKKGMKLIAVVDSGNKSIHGWIPNDDRAEYWRKFYLIHGFCSASMRPSQPVRLAGATRHFKQEENKSPTIQKLLYLDKSLIKY
jgi:hypothetical protein